MWQDMRLAVNHEHAFEFVSPLPDAQTMRPKVPPTSTQEGRQDGKDTQCKVGSFVFQDLTHGSQILSERKSFRRQRARRNREGMFLSDV